MIKYIIILLLIILIILLTYTRYESFDMNNVIKYPSKYEIFKVYRNSAYFKQLKSYDIKLRN